MFVIERFKSDLEAREEAWERARDKYLEERDYYSSREYEEKYPSPKRKFKRTVNGIITGLVIGILLALLVGFVLEIRESKRNQPPKEEIVYNNGDTCHSYKIGDVGIIQYGDYEGAKVEIIGCEKGYEVRVVEDQVLFSEGMPSPRYDDLPIQKGLTFYVNDGNNIQVIGHNDKEKE